MEENKEKDQIEQVFTNVGQSLSSWFTSIQQKTTQTINSIKENPMTQEYSKKAEEEALKYKEKLSSVVTKGKDYVDTNKINGYLDDLDKELEIVENYTLNAFNKFGKFISGDDELNKKSEHLDEEIDEAESNLLFNVSSYENLKKKFIEFQNELKNNETLLTEFNSFNNLITDLNNDELKLQKELNLPDFIKLLSFFKIKKAQPSTVSPPSETKEPTKVKQTKKEDKKEEIKEDKKEEEDDDDDWE